MRKVGLQKPETLAHLVDCLQILVIELAVPLGLLPPVEQLVV